jgi:hypothetical protein
MASLSLFEVLQGKHVLTTSGVRDTNNRAIQARRAMERVQLLTNEPQVMQHPERRYALLYDALQANGTAKPERYLGSVDEWRAPTSPPAAAPPAGTPVTGGMPMPATEPSATAAGPLPDTPYPPQFVQEIAQRAGAPPEAILALAAQLGNPPPEQLLMALQQLTEQQGGGAHAPA